MVDTYTNDLRIREQTVGGNDGTWGGYLTTSLTNIAEAFSYGTENMGSDANTTITIADGTSDEARSLFLKITSTTLSATREVTLAPNTVSKLWLIENATTGSQTITMKMGSGATVDILNGETKMIYTDGAGSGAKVVNALTDLSVAGGFTVAADLDVDGTSNLDIMDVDGAVNFAADVTYADGADIITASAGTSNFRAGVNAGNSIESGGNYNVCVGDEAGTAITTADGCVAVGALAGDAVTTGGNTTAIGYQSATAVTTGINNTGVGAFSLSTETTGNFSVAIGVGALETQNSTGGENSYNTGIGYSAGNLITTGVDNTFIGALAGDATTTSNYNTGVGSGALGLNTTGATNTAVGRNSLRDCSTGSNNSALGDNALNAVTEGGTNVGIGNSAGSSGVGLTTGSQNVIVGDYSHTSAVDSTNQIVMGYNVVGSGNGTITVGNATTDSTMTLGGTTWSAPSDLRYKKNIEDSTAGLSFINDLRPITFEWKNEGDLPEGHNARVEGSTTPYNNPNTNHGFVAQEVKTAIDNHSEIKNGFSMWSEDEADDKQRVADGYLVPMLVKAIQEQSALITALTDRVTTLEG